MTKFLVTTASEKLWPRGKNVILLGEWCKKNITFEKWPLYETIDPFLPEISQKKGAFLKINIIKNKLLSDLSSELNLLHNLEKSERYWNIVLGHWLQRYVEVMYNRYNVIESLEKIHYPLRTVIAESSVDFTVSKDSLAFIYKCNDSDWNHVVYRDLLKYFEYSHIELELHNEKLSLTKALVIKKNLRVFFKSFIHGMISKTLALFSRSTDAFIINSYLNFWDEIKLYIYNKQIPQLWRSPVIREGEFHEELREKIFKRKFSDKNIENFLRENIKRYIPITYAEGFSEIRENILSAGWPTDPKYIFTSNNFDTDDFFKVYTAEAVEKNIKYITGQHGNNYGTHWYSGNEIWPEIASSDAFITWGYENKDTNEIAGFVFKINKKEKVNSNKNGILLLIQFVLPHRLDFFDAYVYHEKYERYQELFYNNLTEDIKNETLVRLHSGYKETGWMDDQRWLKKFPKVQLDYGLSKLSEIVSKARIIVHSYDSTGLLETLTKNIPTLAFWPEDLNHLRQEAEEDYKNLVKAKIIFLDPQNLAIHINEIWDNIDGWWKSNEVQEARVEFCNKYARIENNPAKKLATLLKSITKE